MLLPLSISKNIVSLRSLTNNNSGFKVFGKHCHVLNLANFLIQCPCENKELKQQRMVVHGEPPLPIMIVHREIITSGPAAASVAGVEPPSSPRLGADDSPPTTAVAAGSRSPGPGCQPDATAASKTRRGSPLHWPR